MQVALCQQLVSETWSGKGVVLVNAEFAAMTSTATLPSDLAAFVESVSEQGAASSGR